MNVIVKILVGSHMLGTTTEDSDKDYRSIYIPDIDDVILTSNLQKLDTLRQSTGNNNSKNSKEDIDHELWSLKKFMRLIAFGDTNAIEMLFAHEDNIIEKSPLWDYIILHKQELLHSKTTSFVGYCKTQADKYGLKGSRIAVLKEVLNYLDEYDSYDKLQNVWDGLRAIGIEHLYFGEDKVNSGNHTIEYMEVCSKKFQGTIHIHEAKTRIYKALRSYGERAKLAEENKGIDFKALSHALRVCYQAMELLTTGHITLPHQGEKRKRLIDIKKGKVDFKEIQQELEDKLEIVVGLEKEPTLPIGIDEQKWCKDFIVDAYLGRIEWT